MSLRKIELKTNIDLKKYTSLRIGGRAKYFFKANSIEDFQHIFRDITSPFYILGKGSNLLIKDGIIKTPIIKLSSNFSYIEKENNYLKIGASTTLSSLMNYCLRNNLKGLENLIGIPATIGGLLCMNASSFGRAISSCVEEAEVMDREGKVKVLKKDQIVFEYRASSLQNYIILGAKFILTEERNLKEEMSSLLKRRLSLQDFNFPSCGCVFKNRGKESAAFLIDSCGLKGMRKGDASVSSKHANFIINLGSATYDDVDYLISKIKDRVYKKYSIILEEEIVRWT